MDEPFQIRASATGTRPRSQTAGPKPTAMGLEPSANRWLALQPTERRQLRWGAKCPATVERGGSTNNVGLEPR